MVAFIDGGCSFGSLVFYRQFLDLFLLIVEWFVGDFVLVHRRATWLMPAALVGGVEFSRPELRGHWPYSLKVFSACSTVLVSSSSTRYSLQASAQRAPSTFLKLMWARRGSSIMDSSELMEMRMGKWSLASEVETDQFEPKLMSSEVDRTFNGSRVASFSLRMV